MKILVICLFVSIVSCAHLQKRQSDVNNIDNIQQLLKELEKANANVNGISNNVNKEINNVRNDTPVRDALQKLFGAFQQMASAYVNVLTSVGKSIGLPTIPIGSSRIEFMQAPSTGPNVIGLKQIAENLRQFQNSVQEVTRTVSNMVTRDGPVDNYVVLNEVQKFMRLWSHQIQEVSDQITKAFGGLEADVGERTIPQSLKDLVNNMIKIFDDTVDNISQSMNKMLVGEQPQPGQPGKQPNPNVRDEDKAQQPSKPSNSDMLREFKNLLEIIQKRMRILSQQLDTLLASPTSSDKLKAEHREGTSYSYF